MKILKVNMTEKSLFTETLPDGKVLGGRGLVDEFLIASNAAMCHPLSFDNILVFAPGLFAGTNISSSGRMSVGAKSPLTGGIKEANVGGTAAHKLGRLGIQGIVIGGKSDQWQILLISKEGASFEAADGLIGLTNYTACKKLIERYGSKIGIIITGSAGEIGLPNSTVAVTDTNGYPSRHAARGGLGAVMGSKRLKAVIIEEEGAPIRKGNVEDAFRQAAKELSNAIFNGPFTKMLNTMGTPVFVDMDNERGSLPTHNHRLGSFDKVRNLNAEAFLATVKANGGSMGHGCMPGCAIRCSTIYHDPEGHYLTSALEYETIVLLGSNLGINDLDAIARMDRRCDELGLDTIEMGCTIGVLNDVGLFKFGDFARAEALIEEIAHGTPMGRIMGSGVAIAAKVFGIDRVPAVKGQGLPGHSARSIKGWGVTYATSPQGADHTAGAVLEDPLSPQGQHERSRNSQINMAAFDCTGLCQFTFLARNPIHIIPAINALYGVEWTIENYLEMGRKVLREERTFNQRTGFGQEADRLPYWMTKEPLPPTNAVFDVSEEDLDSVFNF
jgi:aldehyde:ferredoxin oxidoreductase